MATINALGTQTAYGWPYQKRSTSQKGKKFCKECLEAVDKMPSDKLTSEEKKEISTNEQIVKGKLDRETIEKELKPYNMSGVDDGKVDHIQSFPLLKDKVDLLVGEEWKRKFDWQVVVVNPDAINQKQENIKQNIYKFLMEKAVEDSKDKEDLVKEIKRYNKYMKYSYKDLNEIRSNRILNKLWRDLELKKVFNKGFRDLLEKRGEVFCIDIVGGKPDVRKVELENIEVFRMGDSEDIEDADIVKEESFESPGWIIDHYYDYLTEDQVRKIDRGLTDDDGDGMGSGLNYTDPDHGYPTFVWNNDMTDLINTNNSTSDGKGPKDGNGNIRVTRVVWKSLRKLGRITWVDEDGDKQEKIVDENYKPAKGIGEDVEWLWVNEWWETTRIGKDIYVKMQPRPVKFRKKGNISLGGSGYVGIIKDDSLVDLMKPFQIMYDIFMDRTKDAFMKAKGMIMKMDISRKPRGWAVKKWFHYINKWNIMIEDPFNEGDAGAAKGKIAGNMQQSSGATMDMTLGNYIQQHISMLSYIEQRIGDIAGIPRAREGQASANETATGVRNSVSQSYHITEPYFADHEMVKEKVLEHLLETAKYCYRENPELIQFYTNDLGNVIDKVGGEDLFMNSYGIDVTSSSEDSQLLEEYKQLAHAAIQNDKMNLSTLGSIYASPSMSKIRREIEEAEEESEDRQEAAEKRQMKAEQAKQQREAQDKEKDRQVELQKNAEDNKTKIVTELIKADTDIQQTETQENVDMERILQEYNRLEKEMEDSEKQDEQKGQELELKAEEIKQKREEMRQKQAQQQESKQSVTK